jgi:hypothetical protein
MKMPTKTREVEFSSISPNNRPQAENGGVIGSIARSPIA